MENVNEFMNNPEALIAGLSFGAMLLLIIFLLILHVAVCFVPFFVARKKGRSGLLWFVISLAIGWLWAVVILFIVGDSTEKKINDMEKYYQK